MRIVFLVVIIVGSACSSLPAKEFVFQGDWKTTNRRLDGQMTCEVTPVAKEKWQGRFHGVWQGVPFDYTVDFTGTPKDLRGRAVIDGASYEWRAWINQERFKANFSGDRYTGSFDLKRATQSTSLPGSAVARGQSTESDR